MPTTFTNQATLSYNNQSIPSNVVTGVLTEVLSVSKTAIPAAYQNGDTITYAVQLVNSGTAALTGLTLTDNLGAYTPAAGTAAVVPMTYQSDTLRYYRNGILQATPTIAATSPLTVTGLSIPAGGNTIQGGRRRPGRHHRQGPRRRPEPAEAHQGRHPDRMADPGQDQRPVLPRLQAGRRGRRRPQEAPRLRPGGVLPR